MKEENKADFELSIWLHSHFETHKLIEVELFGVTKVHNGFAYKSMFKAIEQELFEAMEAGFFNDFEVEKPYLIDSSVYYDDNDNPCFEFTNCRIDLKAVEECDATNDQ
jgi:hypothetical protein